jgi:hypothetical protein
LLHQTDTRRQAEQWCYKNLAASSRIDYDFFGPRFLIPAFESQRVKLFSRPGWNEYSQKRGPQFYIQDEITKAIFLSHPETFPTEVQWYKAVSEGKLIKQFHGEKFYLLNPQINIYDVSINH